MKNFVQNISLLTSAIIMFGGALWSGYFVASLIITWALALNNGFLVFLGITTAVVIGIATCSMVFNLLFRICDAMIELGWGPVFDWNSHDKKVKQTNRIFVTTGYRVN